MTWDRDDEIGYGKPPRYTRFQKGKSGNPKGRPRKARVAETPSATDFDDTLRELHSRKLKIKVGGQLEEMPAFKAIATKQQSLAFGGNTVAIRDIMRDKKEIDERDALREAAAAEQERLRVIEDQESQHNLYRYLVSEHAKQTEVYRLAKEAGEEPNPRYPHPDDFIFDHSAQKATILVPWNETDAHFYRQLAKQRDHHLLNYVVLDRQRPRGSKFHRNLALFEMVGIDVLTAKHQQLQGSDLDMMLRILLKLPMAELRAWRNEVEFWLKLNPMPEPSKKVRRRTYKIVNTVMKPYLKASGFRSVAQLERHCEEEEEREKAG